MTALLGAAAATGPSTPLAEEGSATTSSGPASAASTGRRAASPRPASPSPSCSHSHSQSDSRSQGSAVAPAELHAVVVHAQAAASRRQELSLHHLRSASIGGGRGGQGGGGVDIPALVERLKQRPLSGQVVAWAWECAAALSAVRRTMPAQLFSALWPATEACACRMMPQVGPLRARHIKIRTAGKYARHITSKTVGEHRCSLLPVCATKRLMVPLRRGCCQRVPRRAGLGSEPA